MNEPQVPEFQSTTPSTGEGHFTPLPEAKPSSGRKPFLIGLTLLIAIILPVAGFYVYTQKQTTNSQASVPACHTGAPPLPPDPLCYTGSAPSSLGDNNWKSCGSPAEGTCKKKNGACYECRDRFEGLRIICSCTEPTPTPEKPKDCVSPLTCMDPAEATALGCAPSSDLSNSNMCSRDGGSSLNGVCCKKEIPTPSPTPTPTREPSPTPTPTPSPTPTPTVTPTPTITQACVLPVITVTATCATCSSPAQ